MECTPNSFNWNLYKHGYTGGSRLIPNNEITGNSKNSKCFSRESYAQDLFNRYTHSDVIPVKKDLIKGDIVKITNIFNINENFIDVELAGGLTVTVDLNREKRFIQIFGYTNVIDFTNDLKETLLLNSLIERGNQAYIVESTPTVKISLWQGHLQSVRDEFMKQIQNPTNAYTAKIIEANKGGFFVEVQGIDAFMPGSLAAPNKINDFQSYIGKEVVVMIEDFLKDMNSFIVSHKKYLTHILPIKIQELDITQQFQGTITGSSKYGIFIEFDMFTGLLHTSKMDNETRELFDQRKIYAGDDISFYISEITKDNRIILTKESPEEKLNKIQKFVLDSKDKELLANIAAIMNFGMIVSIEEITGLIPIKEFKKKNIMINNFMTGQTIKVFFDEFKDEKIIFKL